MVYVPQSAPLALDSLNLETWFRPVAFCLAIAFVFRYTSLAGPKSRRLFNYTTFAFIALHVIIKVYEESDVILNAVIAVFTVLIFHFLNSIMIPAFVFFNLTDIIKGYIDRLFQVESDASSILDYVPPTIVLFLWVLIFPYVDIVLITIFEATGVFTNLVYPYMYDIGYLSGIRPVQHAV